MKEVYTSLSECAKDLDIDRHVLCFMAQKNLTQAIRIEPITKQRRQRRYTVFTRKLCAELGKPFEKNNGE